MEQNELTSIDKIITIPLEDFHTDYFENYFYDIVIKYKDNVISYNITKESGKCYILLKGKIKYFMVRFDLDDRLIERISDKDMKNAFPSNTIIVDPEEFDRFKKFLLLMNLNPKT